MVSNFSLNNFICNYICQCTDIYATLSFTLSNIVLLSNWSKLMYKGIKYIFQAIFTINNSYFLLITLNFLYDVKGGPVQCLRVTGLLHMKQNVYNCWIPSSMVIELSVVLCFARGKIFWFVRRENQWNILFLFTFDYFNLKICFPWLPCFSEYRIFWDQRSCFIPKQNNMHTYFKF